MNFNQLLLKSIKASIEAGNAILDVYHSDFAVEQKDDKSPLTLADKRSHEIIVNSLKEFDIPIPHTAAGQAIAENADAKVFRHNTNEQIIYNKENLLNPWFVVLRTMQ